MKPKSKHQEFINISRTKPKEQTTSYYRTSLLQTNKDDIQCAQYFDSTSFNSMAKISTSSSRSHKSSKSTRLKDSTRLHQNKMQDMLKVQLTTQTKDILNQTHSKREIGQMDIRKIPLTHTISNKWLSRQTRREKQLETRTHYHKQDLDTKIEVRTTKNSKAY